MGIREHYKWLKPTIKLDAGAVTAVLENTISDWNS